MSHARSRIVRQGAVRGAAQVGHIKTVIILMGGCMFFGDTMPPKKAAGISIAMGGIIWYSQVGLQAPPPPPRRPLMLDPCSYQVSTWLCASVLCCGLPFFGSQGNLQGCSAGPAHSQARSLQRCR